MAGNQNIDVPSGHHPVEQPSGSRLNHVDDAGADDVHLVPGGADLRTTYRHYVRYAVIAHHEKLTSHSRFHSRRRTPDRTGRTPGSTSSFASSSAYFSRSGPPSALRVRRSGGSP